jgi:hypothetical protein
MSTNADKEQVKSVNDAAPNPDAELAIAQGKLLKEEVLSQSSSFSKAVSSAVTNTHRLVSLLRESVKGGDSSSAAEKKLLDDLWTELDRLFRVSKDAQAAWPKLMEKQNENARLYHGSMAHAAMKENELDLQIQHRKVDIQYVCSAISLLSHS